MNHLQNLCSLCGVSGDEGQVCAYILKHLPPDCTHYVDALGNLIVEKQGQNRAKRKVMVCAHMDEVGFVINHITKDGYLGFLAVGGIDDKVLLAKQVQVGPRRIPGVIGARAVHQLKGEGKEKAAKIDTLLIDIGAQSEQEAREYVQEGDNAYFIPNYEEHGEMVFSKALDDRARLCDFAGAFARACPL